jgi:hypothetical protein
VRKILWLIYKHLHWHNDYPGASRGRFLDGLKELYWIRLCGHSWRFSLHIANIYWKLPGLTIDRLVSK